MTYSNKTGNGNLHRNTSSVASGKLEKAKLISNESDNIEFMFNPTELVFQQSISLNSSEGARTKSGLPKVSFAYPNPCVLNLSNIIFDTYEKGTSVIDYLKPIIKAVDFSTKGDSSGKRPPIYLFTWGQYQYLRCFVEQVSYKLTLFLPDGTPVQARVDMTLKEVDEAFSAPDSKQSTTVDRERDSRENRTLFDRSREED